MSIRLALKRVKRQRRLLDSRRPAPVALRQYLLMKALIYAEFVGSNVSKVIGLGDAHEVTEEVVEIVVTILKGLQEDGCKVGRFYVWRYDVSSDDGEMRLSQLDEAELGLIRLLVMGQLDEIGVSCLYVEELHMVVLVRQDCNII